MTTTTPLRELIQHIVVEHHGYLRRNLPLLADRIAVEGSDELAAEFQILRSELMAHLDKEEAVLFPAIDRFEKALESGEPLPKLYFGSMRLPIAVIEEEHRIADGTLARIRELTNDYTRPAGLSEALRDLDENLRIHMALENENLFARTLTMETN